jgi:hypothetical protein
MNNDCKLPEKYVGRVTSSGKTEIGKLHENKNNDAK